MTLITEEFKFDLNNIAIILGWPSRIKETIEAETGVQLKFQDDRSRKCVSIFGSGSQISAAIDLVTTQLTMARNNYSIGFLTKSG